MNLVDVITGKERWALAMFGSPVDYVLNDGGHPTATLQAYTRGIRADDLFAGATQQDQAAVIDAAAFRAAFPSRALPQRFDRLRIGPISWAVEEWRGAPNNASPVFFKLLLRGGTQ